MLADAAKMLRDASADPARNASWCPQCGPDVACDEDGCCVTCGADAVGDGANQAHALRREKIERDVQAVELAAAVVKVARSEPHGGGTQHWYAQRFTDRCDICRALAALDRHAAKGGADHDAEPTK